MALPFRLTPSRVTVNITKVPSIVRHMKLASPLDIEENISAFDGVVIIVRVLDTVGRNNRYELCDGRIGRLYKDDVLPVVLGPRRAPHRFSGDVPAIVGCGDVLELLCMSGVVGRLCGEDPTWGRPLLVQALGSPSENRTPMTLRRSMVEMGQSTEDKAKIVAVVGTSMDSGKTTTACRIIRHFREGTRTVAAVKLAGVGSVQDLNELQDAGAEPVLSFADRGVVATCGVDKIDVEKAATQVLAMANAPKPDLIVAEFGGGLVDEYRVLDLLRLDGLREHVAAVVVCAGDLTGARGAKNVLKECGLEIAVVSGPAVNNMSCARFAEEILGTPQSDIIAESNGGTMPSTMRHIEHVVSRRDDEIQDGKLASEH